MLENQILYSQTKICTKCNVEQSIDCFSKDNSTKYGLRNNCKWCVKRYRQDNKEKIAEYQKQYQQDNKEQMKQYYQGNKETIYEQKIQYRQDNKEKIAEHMKHYYQANKEKIAEQGKQYRQTLTSKAIRKNASHKRRTKTKQGDVTTKQLLELQLNAKACYWCNCSLGRNMVHIDHYVPLSKGGEHTISNLVVACRKCNLAKHAKDPIIFAKEMGKLL